LADIRLPALLMLVVACSKAEAPTGQAALPEPTASQIAYAEQAAPSDAALAAIYDRSCKACHGLTGLGAPLTGHAEAWKLRTEDRSISELIASVRNGLNAMPAMGYCPDCTDADFEALIRFMSSEEY
jgi:cytochrome c5